MSDITEYLVLEYYDALSGCKVTHREPCKMVKLSDIKALQHATHKQIDLINDLIAFTKNSPGDYKNDIEASGINQGESLAWSMIDDFEKRRDMLLAISKETEQEKTECDCIIDCKDCADRFMCKLPKRTEQPKEKEHTEITEGDNKQ